jgi:protease YdgD
MISSNSLKSSTAKQLVWGTNDPNKFRAHDWAFLVLNDNLGDTYGWMGTNQNYNYDNGYVNMAGYSGNFMNGQTAGVHINCNFRGPSEGFVLHDCDSSRGSSGGPMFFTNVKNESTIVAINVGERRDGGDTSLFLGEYEETHANVAVYASKFLPKLKELLK